MKVYLNVRINLTSDGRTFTVWARPNLFLPGIEFHTGSADNLSDAVRALRDSLPDDFPIDDEFSVMTSDIEFTVIRPFQMVRSESIRTFVVC